jgi:hypothetical protein
MPRLAPVTSATRPLNLDTSGDYRSVPTEPAPASGGNGAASWDRGQMQPTLLVVDAANVVGSVPDGWWRDREGAARRLRDALVAVARDGLAVAPPPVEVVLVVEGAARRLVGVPGVRVVAAERSGDDAIVALVRDRPAGQECLVVTGDRGLRERVMALGAQVTGPRSLGAGSRGRRAR